MLFYIFYFVYFLTIENKPNKSVKHNYPLKYRITKQIFNKQQLEIPLPNAFKTVA